MQSKLRPQFDSLLWKSVSLTWVGLGTFWLSALAYAHGDDDVTAASFIGPLVSLLVFVTVVGLGKALLRAIVKKA